MVTPIKHRVRGQITIRGVRPSFQGNEVLYVAVRDTLQHDADCIELGSIEIPLRKGQSMPIDYQFSYEPRKAHMKFDELKRIPGGITLCALIERNGELLYANNTDSALAEHVDMEVVNIDD